MLLLKINCREAPLPFLREVMKKKMHPKTKKMMKEIEENLIREGLGHWVFKYKPREIVTCRL